MISKQAIFKILERSYIDLISYFIVFILLIIFYFRNTPHNYIGIFVSIFGFFIWIKGRYDLGKSFQIESKAKKLITTGIYSKIRHPIYLGVLIVTIGFIISALNTFLVYYLIVYAIILGIMQFIRMKREERLLELKFGKEYIKYTKQTWI